jgi:hypothetical protein
MPLRARLVPGVIDAAAVFPHPFRGNAAVDVECEGCGPGPLVARAAPQTITAGYLSTMRIPLLSGRPFDRRDQSGAPPSAIVSETLARRLWGEPAAAVGRRVRLASAATPGPWLTVVGASGDVRKTYSDSLYPDLYRPFDPAPRAYNAIMVQAAGDPAALEGPVRRAVAAGDESLAISDVESMATLLRARRGRSGIMTSFVGVVAVLSLGLTVFGLYAVVSYLVHLRRREFALRIALGARPAQIVRAVFGEARAMVLVGLGSGLALATLAVAWSRSRVARVAGADLPTYLTVVAVVAAIVGVALVAPVRTAGGVDPAAALRED